jgi:hypothetical protein
LPSTTLKSAIACVSLSIRDCELTARFQMPLSGFNERSTKLASKHLSIGQTGKAPTAIPLASTMLMHLMRLYAARRAQTQQSRRHTGILTGASDRQLSSLRPQKPKHYDDGDAEQC